MRRRVGFAWSRSSLAVLLLGACAAVRPVEPGRRLVDGFDAHLHVTMALAGKPLFQGLPGGGVLTWNPRARLVNHVEAPHLAAAGITAAFAALWPPLAARPGRRETDEALWQLSLLDDFALANPAWAVARSPLELERAVALGRLALVPQVEGGEGLFSEADVDRLFAAGARCITLVHFVSTQLGGAARGQLERNFLGLSLPGDEAQGLSELGARVVRRMIALGVIIDLAHASARLVNDVLAITEPLGVPVLVSHTAARALNDTERNVGDWQLRRIAGGGGLIGVTAYAAQLEVAPAARAEGQVPGTCDDLVAHWRHLAQVVPPEQLVFGSDLNSFITRAAPGGACPAGLRNTADLPAVFAAVERAGVTGLDGMTGRFLRFWQRVEAKADGTARAEALAAAREQPGPPSLFP